MVVNPARTYRYYVTGMALTLIDAVATRLAVALGSYEVNPILVAVQNHVGLNGMLVFRVLVGWLALSLLYRLAIRSYRPAQLLRLVVIVLSVLAGYHVVNLSIYLVHY